jgi:hypothetical protein
LTTGQGSIEKSVKNQKVHEMDPPWRVQRMDRPCGGNVGVLWDPDQEG